MCVVFKIIRVQSPDGMKKIASTKRETAAAFLKKVYIVLPVNVFKKMSCNCTMLSLLVCAVHCRVQQLCY